GIVGEDETVETIKPVFRVAAGPRTVLGPGVKRRELRMRGTECPHRVRVLAARGAQQFVKALRRRHLKKWRIDYIAAPFLPTVSGSAVPHPAPGPSHPAHSDH